MSTDSMQSIRIYQRKLIFISEQNFPGSVPEDIEDILSSFVFGGDRIDQHLKCETCGFQATHFLLRIDSRPHISENIALADR